MALAALAALAEQDDLPGITILCAGSDGEDGPTDAAGAFVDRSILRRARARGLEADRYLARHDSYAFFSSLGGLFRTGLTGTNVMDLAVVLVAPAPSA
jgi:hydroxypyruvate reductase